MSTRRKSRPVRLLLRAAKWLLVLALAAAAGAYFFAPRPVEVDAGPVTRGAMRVTVDDDGETRVRERYAVAAPVSGQLGRIELDPGDAVAEGDVLARVAAAALPLLDARAVARAEAAAAMAEEAVVRAAAARDGAESEAERAAKEFARAGVLHGKGNLADAAFEAAEAAHRGAAHALAAAESALKMARFDAEQARAALLYAAGGAPAAPVVEVRSPASGRVLRVREPSARDVMAGTVLLEVGDPSALELRVDVLSQDAVKIEPGAQAIIEHWGGEGELAARVRRVEPSGYTKVSALGVEEQRVDVIADFDEPAAAAALGDGYRVEARIVVWEAGEVLRVPAGALFRAGDGWGVYRVEGGVARLVGVEVGRDNGEVAEIRSGLAEGDEVILHPGDRVSDGARVRIRDRS